MAELCIVVPSLEKAQLLRTLTLSQFTTTQSAWSEYLNQNHDANESLTYLNDVVSYFSETLPLTRLYIGNEFCERLLPSESELRAFYELANENKLKITLLSAPQTHDSIHNLRKLLKILCQLDPEPELVVNDLGTLSLISAFPTLKPILGRTLTTMNKIPQMAARPPRDLTKSQIFAISEISLSQEKRLAWYKSKYGIHRFECDATPQRPSYSPRKSQTSGSLYIPWVYLAGSRCCELAGLNLPQDTPIHAHTPCQKECQKFTIKNYSDFSNGPGLIFSKGKALFMYLETPIEVLESYVREQGFDRIIVQQTLPF